MKKIEVMINNRNCPLGGLAFGFENVRGTPLIGKNSSMNSLYGAYKNCLEIWLT